MKESNETNLRKTIYRKTAIPGIRSVWDWSEKKNDYVQRSDCNRYIATVEKNGRSTSKSFNSIETARYWREKMKYDLARLPSVGVLTFKDLLNKFFERKTLSAQVTTLESYALQSRHFMDLMDIEVEDINGQTIDKWLDQIKSPEYRIKALIRNTRLSFRHEVKLLKNVFSYYREYCNERFENPVRARHRENAVVDQKRINERKQAEASKYISLEEIENVLAIFKRQADLKPNKRMYYLMALVQLRTGLRIGEVAALRWEDINWDDGIVIINKTLQWSRKRRPTTVRNQTKSGEIRNVKFLNSVLGELKQLQLFQGRIKGLIFSDDGSEFATYRCIQHHYDYAFVEAKVSFRSTHILRHTFATQFLEVTADNNALQHILGHKNYKMTAKYAKTTDHSALRGMMTFEKKLSHL